MPEIGQTISHYRIIEKLGQGGMGEVFLAHDTSLDRKVALKFLPDLFSGDPERLARFEREAKLLASLNHPNIATIYGLEQADGKRFLAMELVEGQTLAQQIERGPMPVDESLEVCRQIAEGLEAAHERGIIHRDLKPANVKITREGKVKILDFGLAKALQDEAPVVDASKSPTLTDQMTRAGVILGTAAYMSPEQARGGAVDKRADVWAFGVILFELLTAKGCFPGDTVTDVLAAVVKSEPDWTALPVNTPEPARQLLRRCLAKDRKQRLRDVADARLDIEAAQSALAGPGAGATAAVPTATPGGLWPRRRAWTLAAATLVAGAAIATALIWRFHSQTTVAGILRLDLPVAPADEINSGGLGTVGIMSPGGSRTALAWTPDGQALVFVGRHEGVQKLYVRRLDGQEARPLEGTEGARVPAVSEDGKEIAFWADKSIKRVAISGGPVTPLFEKVGYAPYGMAWSKAGLLIGAYDAAQLSLGSGTGSILLVTQDGASRSVTSVKAGEFAHILPRWLPGNAAFLYTARKRAWSWSDEEVIAYDLATGKYRTVVPKAVDARPVPGYLVFLREKSLWAMAFDANRLERRGEPVAILDDVAQALANSNSGDVTGAGQFGITSSGHLAYLEDRLKPWPDNVRLVKVDRKDGKVTPLPAPSDSYATSVRVDPRERWIGNATNELGEKKLWVFDLIDGRVITPLGEGGEVGSRLWTPDGKGFVFRWFDPKGEYSLVRQIVASGAPVEKLGIDFDPCAWTPKRELIGMKGDDIWILSNIDDKTTARKILGKPGIKEQWPAVAPDGRWLVYGSDESGRTEIYLVPYPELQGGQTVSVDGGLGPSWNPRGGELFYISLPDREGFRWMMSVTVPGDRGERPGVPQRLFRFKATDLRLTGGPVPGYDVAHDGQSFYTTQESPMSSPPVTHVHIILNFLEEVKAKVSQGR